MNARARVEGSAVPTVTIRCLGPFGILGRKGWLSGPDVSRGKQLIGYLVVHARAVALRETLAEAFWPDADFDASAHRLHLVASAARASLRKALGSVEAITCQDGGYGWTRSIKVDSDAARLLELEKRGDLESCRQARQLYQGELLAGVQGDWLEPMRLRCAAAYASMLERLAESAYAAGDYSDALDRSLELLSLDRAYEPATRLVMRCFAAIGRPFQAHAVFTGLEQFLGKRLAVSPTTQTRALLEHILASGRRQAAQLVRGPARTASEEPREV